MVTEGTADAGVLCKNTQRCWRNSAGQAVSVEGMGRGRDGVFTFHRAEGATADPCERGDREMTSHRVGCPCVDGAGGSLVCLEVGWIVVLLEEPT